MHLRRGGGGADAAACRALCGRAGLGGWASQSFGQPAEDFSARAHWGECNYIARATGQYLGITRFKDRWWSRLAICATPYPIMASVALAHDAPALRRRAGFGFGLFARVGSFLTSIRRSRL